MVGELGGPLTGCKGPRMEGHGQRSRESQLASLGMELMLMGFLYSVRYCTRGVISIFLQVFYRWGSEMVRNFPNVSLELAETKIQNQACALQSQSSSRSPERPTLFVWNAPQPSLHCSGCDAFSSSHSIYSVGTRGLSSSIACLFVVITHILVPFCILFRELPMVLYQRGLWELSGPSLCSKSI